MPTGVACLAADFVGKGGCEGAVCFHPILFVAFPLARTPQLPFTIKPGGLTCYTTTGVSCLQCGQCGHAWMKFPAHNKKATDTQFRPTIHRYSIFILFWKKKVRLQVLAKSQTWPVGPAFLKMKLVIFESFCLRHFYLSYNLRNGHSF